MKDTEIFHVVSDAWQDACCTAHEIIAAPVSALASVLGSVRSALDEGRDWSRGELDDAIRSARAWYATSQHYDEPRWLVSLAADLEGVL